MDSFESDADLCVLGGGIAGMLVVFVAVLGAPALVAPSARDTPPATVQTTAAPVQVARQLNAWRRAGLWPASRVLA